MPTPVKERSYQKTQNVSSILYINKLAVHAAGSDRFRCNYTNKQSAPNQLNRYNFSTSAAILMFFRIQIHLPIVHRVYYSWINYLQLFRCGNTLKLWEEKDESLDQLNTEVFLQQPLASPGSENLCKFGKHLIIFPFLSEFKKANWTIKENVPWKSKFKKIYGGSATNSIAACKEMVQQFWDHYLFI